MVNEGGYALALLVFEAARDIVLVNMLPKCTCIYLFEKMPHFLLGRSQCNVVTNELILLTCLPKSVQFPPPNIFHKYEYFNTQLNISKTTP